MAVAARARLVESEVDHLAKEQCGGERLFRLQPYRRRPEDPIAVAVDCREVVLDYSGGAPEIRPGNEKRECPVRIGVRRCS
jgi:hypothetical protein